MSIKYRQYQGITVGDVVDTKKYVDDKISELDSGIQILERDETSMFTPATPAKSFSRSSVTIRNIPIDVEILGVESIQLTSPSSVDDLIPVCISIQRGTKSANIVFLVFNNSSTDIPLTTGITGTIKLLVQNKKQ